VSDKQATHAAPPGFKAVNTKGKGGGKPSTESGTNVLEGPLHDKSCILNQYKRKYPDITPPKPVYTENPKSALSNWYRNTYGILPQYEYLGGFLDGRAVWRRVFY
jgi:hypothetical protein